MQIGMIGLGRMGASMVTRLLRGPHACVVLDRQPPAMEALVALGAHSAASLPEPSSTTGTFRLAARSEKCAAGQRLAGPNSAPGANTT